jgi:hypothetical protein
MLDHGGPARAMHRMQDITVGFRAAASELCCHMLSSQGRIDAAALD